MNDTRTLEQVILDASSKFCDSRELPPVATVEAAVIADAVREWQSAGAKSTYERLLREDPSRKSEFEVEYAHVVELEAHTTRIKELEAEVAKQKESIEHACAWAAGANIDPIIAILTGHPPLPQKPITEDHEAMRWARGQAQRITGHSLPDPLTLHAPRETAMQALMPEQKTEIVRKLVEKCNADIQATKEGNMEALDSLEPWTVNDITAVKEFLMDKKLDDKRIAELEEKLRNVSEFVPAAMYLWQRLFSESKKRCRELEAELEQLAKHPVRLPPWNDLVAQAATVSVFWEEKIDEHPECRELLDLVEKLSTSLSQAEAEVDLLKGQKCAKPDVASCAKEWEAQHQFRALQEHGLDEEFPYGIDAIQHVAEALVAARAEVERLKAMTYLPSNEAIDKAAKYDALRKRFPYLPEEQFWVFDPDSGKIVRRIAQGITVFGLRDNHANAYRWDECHPTADACKAAIPVEE